MTQQQQFHTQYLRKLTKTRARSNEEVFTGDTNGNMIHSSSSTRLYSSPFPSSSYFSLSSPLKPSSPVPSFKLSLIPSFLYIPHFHSIPFLPFLILHPPSPAFLFSPPLLFSHALSGSSATLKLQEKDRNLRRITRMVLVVVAVFIVCWTPIHIFVIITALINIPSSTLQTITWHFCIALGYTNRYAPGSSL